MVCRGFQTLPQYRHTAHRFLWDSPLDKCAQESLQQDCFDDLGSNEEPQILHVLRVRFILHGRNALHSSEQYQANQGDKNSLLHTLQVYVFWFALAVSRRHRSPQYFLGLPIPCAVNSQPQNLQFIDPIQRKKAPESASLRLGCLAGYSTPPLSAFSRFSRVAWLTEAFKPRDLERIATVSNCYPMVNFCCCVDAATLSATLAQGIHHELCFPHAAPGFAAV
jgi:hypothetical protein